MSGSKTALFVVILLIFILSLYLYNNYYQYGSHHRGDDDFVGQVPYVPIGNGYMPVYSVPGTHPYGQPMMYPEQMYPKTPYYADTVENIGRPCKSPNGCGVFGTCTDGVCTVKDQQKTVFDIKI